MAARMKTRDAQVERISNALRAAFPQLPAEIDEAVYRYNSRSIRVRVIDDRFAGKLESERERMVMKALKGLPPEDNYDITMLLMMTSEEAEEGSNLVDLEFQDPTRSKL